MDIIQCKFCKKPFQSFNSKICPSCLEQIDRDFLVVRDYIYENKKADLDKVTEETGVQKAIVLHLLREGRLQIDNPEEGGTLLMCESCRKPITKGRLCEDCRNNVSSTMKQSLSGDGGGAGAAAKRPGSGSGRADDRGNNAKLRS